MGLNVNILIGLSLEQVNIIFFAIFPRTGVANWFAHLHFMSDFQLAKKLGNPAQNTGDKASFQLATLEAGKILFFFILFFLLG